MHGVALPTDELLLTLAVAATRIANYMLLPCHRQIIASVARLPPPVFTWAAPLPLGSLPAGLPTQLIRLWQGTQHYSASNTTSNGSFSNLITQTSANANTIVQAPLMFVRGGYVSPGDDLNPAGYEGDYWSSVGRNSSSAYRLGFTSGGVSPSLNYIRYFGYSVRCVALGG